MDANNCYSDAVSRRDYLALVQAFSGWLRPSSGSSRRSPTIGADPARGYDAFVSYSHSDNVDLAASLQRGLEKTRRPWYKMRALRIFRDKSSLAVTSALWPEIQKTLSDSAWFVLM